MRLAEFFELIGWGRRGDQGDEPDTRLTATAKDTQNRSDLATFERALRTIFANGNKAPAGRINFLGLDEVRDRLGSRWEALRDRVHRLTRRIVETNLGEDDAFTRCGDLAYVLVFAHLDIDAATVKCAQIAHQIQEALFGDDAQAAIQVRSLVSVVGDELVFVDDPIEERVAKIAAKIAKDGSPADSVRATAHTGIAGRGHDKELRKSPEGVSAQPIASETAIAPVVISAIAPVAISAAAADPVIVASDLLPQAAQATREIRSATIAAPAPAAVDRKPIDFFFIPSWNAQAEAVTGYHCVPFRNTVHGLQIGYAGVYEDHAAVEIDMLAVKTSVETLSELVANAYRYMALQSVHFRTLTTPSHRRAYTATCNTIPTKLRRYLAIEIFGAPAGVPTSRFVEFIAVLRPFFRYVLLRTGLDGQLLTPAGGAGFDGFGVIVADEASNANEIADALVSFAGRVKTMGSECSALDVRAPRTFLAAAEAGFRYVEGPTVLKPVAIPTHAYHYPRSKFIGRL